MGGGICPEPDLGERRRQVGFSPSPVQDAEGFAAKLGSLQTILGLVMIARRGPGLIHMKDRSLPGDSDPELMIEQKMKSGSEPAGLFECRPPKKNRRLSDDLEAEQILQG